MNLNLYLTPTPAMNFEHPAVAEFISSHAAPDAGPRETAVALYYAVRDLIRYDPYDIDLTISGMQASTTLRKGRSWCVPKAVLLAACCRARGIPARLGYADVKNHLSTRRMRELMQTDIFYWHGYTDIYLEERWVKATPAFNRELCQKFKLRPLEFDGREDSIFHTFDLDGKEHMEYLQDRGHFQDLPLAEILQTFSIHYSQLMAEETADFELDVAREISSK